MEAVSKKAKRTCDHPGCEKRKASGAFCKDHLADADAVEGVLRLTELEASRWGRLDAEMRNALQGLRLADLEVEQAKRQFVEFRSIKELEKGRLQGMIEKIRPEYKQLVDELGEKYGIDPTKMAIDPDTRVIRDLSDKKPDKEL